MAITLSDLVSRLEMSLNEMEKCNYGDAAQRLSNTIRILQENGITIHAIAKTDSKKVESNEDNEEE